MAPPTHYSPLKQRKFFSILLLMEASGVERAPGKSPSHLSSKTIILNYKWSECGLDNKSCVNESKWTAKEECKINRSTHYNFKMEYSNYSGNKKNELRRPLTSPYKYWLIRFFHLEYFKFLNTDFENLWLHIRVTLKFTKRILIIYKKE